MAYTINRTNGAVLTTVADGTINNSTDLVLIGKNYAGYGEFFNENMIKLLENFSNSTAPSSPLSGQMWWDSSNNLLKVYTGSAFKTVSSSTASSSTPSGAVTGDLWWDTLNGQLKVYNGASFVLIGPSFTSGTGTSGAIVDTVVDNTSTDHVVVKLFVNNVIVGIISRDPTFTPQIALSGFATISPGIQLSTTVTGAKLQGTATNSDALGTVAAANYLRGDQTSTTTGVFNILNDTGLVVGVDSDLTVGVSGSTVNISNATLDGNINIRVNDGGTPTTALAVDGATSRVSVAGSPTETLHIASKGYVDTTISGFGALLSNGNVDINGVLKPDANNTRDFGTSSLRFATAYATTFNGTATQAQYADLAEKFTSDQQYTPGTLVRISDDSLFEVTKETVDASDDVFGVVSTDPAYLMNSDLENGLNIAVAGRVPVLCIGVVNKGDRLVSAGNGVARSAIKGEVNAFNVVGRALESKDSESVGLVEAFVSVK